MKISKKKLRQIIKEELTAVTEQEDAAQPQAKPKSTRLGQKQVTRQQMAQAEYEKSKRIRGGETLGQGVTPIENAILLDVEEVLTAIAEGDDLNKYRSILQNVVNILRKKAGI